MQGSAIPPLKVCRIQLLKTQRVCIQNESKIHGLESRILPSRQLERVVKDNGTVEVQVQPFWKYSFEIRYNLSWNVLSSFEPWIFVQNAHRPLDTSPLIQNLLNFCVKLFRIIFNLFGRSWRVFGEIAGIYLTIHFGSIFRIIDKFKTFCNLRREI